MLHTIVVNFMPGMPVPADLLADGAAGCALDREVGLFAIVPTDRFLPVVNRRGKRTPMEG